MGWFADYVYIMCYLNLFSSPSGDGLVHWIQSRTVPENSFFSSPLGGGLVRKQNSADLGYFNTFSSPSGDGLVPV